MRLQQVTHRLLCSIVGEVGFLAEDRRINVAVTRARRHIAVVCDTQTVQNHPFLKSLVHHMIEFGEIRTAFEYIKDIVPQNYTREQKEAKAKSSGSKQKSKDPPPGAKRGQKKPPSGGGGGSSSNTANLKEELEEHKAKERHAEIKEQVQRFMNDSERSELQFPPSFNSHDRLLVHQVAEELGLVHESRGEGKERCITVSRPRQPPPVREQTTEEERGEEAAKEEQKENCELEVTAPPLVDLKSLHLERMKREQQKREEKAQQRQQHNNAPPTTTTLPSKKSKTAKGLFPTSTLKTLCLAAVGQHYLLCSGQKKVKAGASEIAAAAARDDDLDALLDAVKKAESVCSFTKCKASVLTLGQLCLFCNRQFCLSHHIPEVRHSCSSNISSFCIFIRLSLFPLFLQVHGCGDKAKSHARMRISREGVLYAGSGRKDTSMDPNKKAYLHRKLDNKLKDMATQRKPKKEEDGK